MTEVIYNKIKQYCRYRERCHFEVKNKLFALGLQKNEAEILLCRLIEEDLLNESRYAELFAGGHFRLKKWGKMKIANALRQKKLGENMIKNALSSIETADYAASLEKLAFSKWKSLKGEHYLARQAKTQAFLLQKGYETAQIREIIKKLQATNSQ